MKKILSVLVCVCVLLSVMVFTASAAETSATLSFAPDENRTSRTDTQQVWEANGIKLTNDKASSNSPIRDNLTDDHIRLYAGTNVKIEYPGMTKIELTCPTTAYAAVWGQSDKDDNSTVVANGTAVTITFATPTDSYSITGFTAQTRIKEMTVYAATAESTPDPEPSCEHTATSAVPNGDETHKLVCDACSETTTPVVDCKDDDVNGKCDVCGGDVEIPVQEPAADSTLTIVDAAALGASMAHDTTTTNKYYVEGTIKKIAHTTYGNMTIEDAEGNTLYIYGTHSADGQTRYDALETKPVEGDTVKLYGVIGNYNGAQMKNGWIVAHTPATTPDEGGDDVTPPAGDEGGEDVTPPAEDATLEVVDVPAVGTAYKFGMNQVGAGKLVYLAGGMVNNYYMATTEDASAALDVYLEETDGGYYIYAMVDGAKQYLNMVVSGTHVNAVYADTATTVFTYDAEKNIMVTIVNDTEYAFGNYGTYTSISTSKTSYDDNYFCQFYAEPIVDDDTTGDDTTGDDTTGDDTTTGGTTGGDNTTGGTTGGDDTDGSTTSPSTGDNVGAFAVMAIAAAVVVAASKKRA